MRAGPLDLRMDPTRGIPAHQRIAEVDEQELARVLLEHGDVRGASRFARVMVAESRAGRLASTLELAALVNRASGGRAHPRVLAQVFQALRIWVNEEAADLDAVLAWLPSAMRAGGVVVTLAYHSGEDRRIKQAIQAPRPSAPPRRLPLAPGTRAPESPWAVLTRKVVKPSNRGSGTKSARAQRAAARLSEEPGMKAGLRRSRPFWHATESRVLRPELWLVAAIAVAMLLVEVWQSSKRGGSLSEARSHPFGARADRGAAGVHEGRPRASNHTHRDWLRRLPRWAWFRRTTRRW